MSQDPKKPFDAPPGTTPELLQKDLPLDRRNRRVPTFEELRAAAPTDPERPAHPRAAPPPPRAAPIPQATVPASPRSLDNGPTVPMPRLPAAARPPAAPPRPPNATPSQYPNAGRPPAAPPPARAQAQAPDATGVLPPRPSSPTEGARTIPPSPADFARMRGQPARPMPQVTPGVPSLGATVPPGQPNAASHAVPMHTVPHAPPRQAPQPEPEPITAPQGRPPVQPAPAPTPAYRATPNVLPPEMLVTQPGMPGPFADKKRVAFQAPEALEAPRPSAPSPAQRRGPASLDDVPAHAPGPSSLADFAALADNTAPGDVFASPASLWRRLAAWLVDVALLGSIVLGLLAGAAQLIAGGLDLQKLPVLLVPGALLTCLLAFVYASLFAFVWAGRTPGRRALGLHLVDDSGHAPSPMRALLRGVLSLVSFGLFLAGFWVALFDRRGQTLHDKLSSTFVVQLRDA